jgi:hypothetical protein
MPILLPFKNPLSLPRFGTPPGCREVANNDAFGFTFPHFSASLFLFLNINHQLSPRFLET